MSEIRAIPTEYAGVQFRSRLEASWAKHFDSRCLPWDYEPEGYELSDGTRYLPDFYLPTAKAWVEVKGDHMQRMSKLNQFAADMWRDSGAASTYDRSAPMILLFQTPRMEVTEWYERIDNSGPLGVLAPGINCKGTIGSRFGSVAMAKCPTCVETTVIYLWQRHCRNCGAEHDMETWMSSVYDFWNEQNRTNELPGFERLGVRKLPRLFP